MKLFGLSLELSACLHQLSPKQFDGVLLSEDLHTGINLSWMGDQDEDALSLSCARGEPDAKSETFARPQVGGRFQRKDSLSDIHQPEALTPFHFHRAPVQRSLENDVGQKARRDAQLRDRGGTVGQHDAPVLSLARGGGGLRRRGDTQ
ncbi:hypothetical protein LZ198_41115 [Myxococcus sp. K15C18031901]|nr:hypothetical protein [Myxococcus dinghuensis]MCP3105289.1 hypothetical protein [Myxococcus dinghuensis]